MKNDRSEDTLGVKRITASQKFLQSEHPDIEREKEQARGMENYWLVRTKPWQLLTLKLGTEANFQSTPPITNKGSIHPAPSRAMLTLKKCALSLQWVCHSAIPHWPDAHSLLPAGLYLSKGAALEWQLTESPEQDDLISKDVCHLCAFPRLLFSQTIRISHRYYLSLSQSEELLWWPQHPTCTVRTVNFQATGR